MIKISKLARGIISAVIVCGMGLCLSPVNGADEPWKPTGKETPASMKARTSDINRPREVGKYYEATVPDTLDLAERAWLGINHFTRLISEKDNYEMYWGAMACNYPPDLMKLIGHPDWTQWGGDLSSYNPPILNMQMSPLMACQAKAVDAMAMERLMSGSQQLLEREARMLEMMASNLGEDGLYYVPKNPKKWWLGPDAIRPYAHINGQVRMMRAMIAWYQYTGDPKWKERIDRMVDGLDRHLVVHKDDYAYVPARGWADEEYFRSCYTKGRGWKDVTEPKNEKAGEEGSLFVHQGEMPGPLANWYVLTGNKQALRLAGEMVRFLTKPKFWADWKGGEYPGVVGAEHAHWTGHYHGHMYVLRAILEYAIAANDSRLKQFVRDGYEWARQSNLVRIGLMSEDGQGCGCGRAIGLAVKLSDAGVGDYWEDVDLYIRNLGTEMQFTPEDIPYMRRLSEGKPAPPEDASLCKVGVVETLIGSFSNNAPGKSGTALCCSPWGNMSLFYAWDGTLRYADGVARINLLLNRASPWMDIDSSIPYEGKVVLRNKTAKEAFVRMPLYAHLGTVTCTVGSQKVQPRWFGRYLRLDNLKAEDVVTIEFPLEERIERWTAPPSEWGWPRSNPPGTVFTLLFKGNTLIKITPPLASDSPLFQQRPERYKLAKAPVKNVTRYVTPQTLKW